MIPKPDALLQFLLQQAEQPLTARELIDQLRVSEPEEAEFLRLLEERVAAGDVVEIKGGKYACPSRVGLVVGRVQVHPDGFGFVIPDDRDHPDLFVKPIWLKAVMNGDRVVARVETKGRRPEGRVIRVLTRATATVIGQVRVSKKFATVVPLDERLLHEVVVSRDDLLGAADGQVVQVEITAYPTAETGAEGRVVQVLGNPGQPEVEAKAIALKRGVRVEFPADALAEAEKVSLKVRKADLEGREDLRHLAFATIDGEKARDFDDAVSIERLERGELRLWVAIADVSHYVAPGTALDAEAYARGTSTYFPDRVFPMLPERLSNGICSLNPGEDRLAMVAELVFSRGGRRRTSRFYPAVIQSRHRLTYTVVAEILGDPDCEAAAGLADVVPGLLRMGELARALRSRRQDRGSIDFDLPAAEIILDLQGRPEDIVKSERNEAHFLIEEFMIAANEAVAEHLGAKKIPCPYRIHGDPDPDKVEEFRRFVHNLGYTLKGRQKLHPRDFQDLARQVEGKPEERMINHMMLRAMRKAEYNPQNIGHFGLASEHYAHFTSPIRRYPDLILHRHLRATFKKRAPAKTWREQAAKYLDDACPHLSARERASEGAEREAVSWKKCEFMADKVGSEHWGFVTGIASFGVFVELESYFVEGLVHVSGLTDDFYHFSEETQALIGERTRRTFRIGDRLRVRVDRVAVDRRQIDFGLVQPPAPAQEGGGAEPRAERSRGQRRGGARKKGQDPAPEPKPQEKQRSRSGRKPRQPAQEPEPKGEPKAEKSRSRRRGGRRGKGKETA
ncbi:MAG: ribonuclease R [Deferrisomatales bacterium]